VKVESAYINGMNELVFEVTQEADGGLVAECLTEAIFTQADTWDQLRDEVLDAVNGYYFDREKPEKVRLHMVRDEVLLAG
jgi:hypothetical protein